MENLLIIDEKLKKIGNYNPNGLIVFQSIEPGGDRWVDIWGTNGTIVESAKKDYCGILSP